MLEWLGEMHWWWLNLFAFLGNMLGIAISVHRCTKQMHLIDDLLQKNLKLLLENMKLKEIENELVYLKSKYGEK